MAVLGELFAGKTISRALVNRELSAHTLRGVTVDVGGGAVPASHYRFLRADPDVRIVTVNIAAEVSPDVVADANLPLPLREASADTVLACNLIEHLRQPDTLFCEARRVLREGGRLLGCAPFLVPVHGDPHDYARYTATALTDRLTTAGFDEVSVTPVGTGPFVASVAMVEVAFPRPLIALAYLLGGAADRLIRRVAPEHGADKYPLGYVFSGVH